MKYTVQFIANGELQVEVKLDSKTIAAVTNIINYLAKEDE